MFAPDLVVVLVLLESMIFFVPLCLVFGLATELFADARSEEIGRCLSELWIFVLFNFFGPLD